MSKKVFNLVIGIVGGISAIGSAIVTYFNPEYAVQIVASIGIGATAINEICSLFVKEK